MKEIDNLPDFENWLNKQQYIPAAVQELNLTDYSSKIRKLEFKGSLFLGCKLDNETSGHITSTGGIVIPNLNDLEYKVHKSKLYNTKDLFEGFDINNIESYKNTKDYKIYKEYVENGMENPPSIRVSLTRRLHDHSITDALYELIEGRKVVAIMGGHSMLRQDKFYLKVAKISRILTQKGFLMVSGGGPGAMEATHIGAYFAARPESKLIEAINKIKIRPKDAIPNKEYLDKDWLHRAFRIMKEYSIPNDKVSKCMSIGIPTWLYGHEPPTPFATHIAKYFANSVREDGLVTIAKHGIIFAPGSAGTTQEIFQDATQNHYAPYNTQKVKKIVSPMILFGYERWTKERPVWDFLKKVSKDRPYGELLCLSENEDEIIKSILDYKPEDYSYPKN